MSEPTEGARAAAREIHGGSCGRMGCDPDEHIQDFALTIARLAVEPEQEGYASLMVKAINQEGIARKHRALLIEAAELLSRYHQRNDKKLVAALEARLREAAKE